MSIQYVRQRYGVPAKVGMRVRIEHPETGREIDDGRITSASGGYIHLDCAPYHPTWGTIYYDGDEVVWSYKDEGGAS